MKVKKDEGKEGKGFGNEEVSFPFVNLDSGEVMGCR